MNQAERPPINLRRPSKHEKAVLLQNYAAKRRSSVRPAMTGTRRNTTGALTVNGSSARRLRTASVAVGLEATARPDGGAPLEAASEPSLSCFGALCSVIRAATDYCRYGNLRQYLLIDPESGEPKHIYSAGRYILPFLRFSPFPIFPPFIPISPMFTFNHFHYFLPSWPILAFLIFYHFPPILPICIFTIGWFYLFLKLPIL